MSETLPVYGHRDVCGFAFVSFGDDGPDYHNVQFDGQMSGTEYVESVLFDWFGDDVWGPSPSEADVMDADAVRNAASIPVESDRGDELYQVGTVDVDEYGFVQDVNPFESVTEVNGS